jgi:adenylate cyclase
VNAEGSDQIWSRRVHQENGTFVSDRRVLDPTTHLGALPIIREPGTLDDPTSHPTFVTPASQEFYGTLLPSDLHWSQLDADLPEPQRRVEVSVQQVITDPDGDFLGVLRVGLLARQLDEAMRLTLAAPGKTDPHRIFLCDKEGRLITRITPEDRIVEMGIDLRVSFATLPSEIKTALADPRIRNLTAETPAFSGQFNSGGEEYLSTFRALEGTQDWVVGIVVPRSHYLGKLAGMRDRLLAVSLGIMLFIVAVGSLILRGVKRAQAQVTKESLKMNAFDFSAAPTDSAFRDVSEVLGSLEKAKTAMRAMGKYAPIDLVRRHLRRATLRK